MKNLFQNKIGKYKEPFGSIKQKGFLANANDPQDVYTDQGLRTISLQSRIYPDGRPVAGQDTVGIMSNPSNNSSVHFTLGADGNQEISYITGSGELTPMSKDNRWFLPNVDRIREVIGKARFSGDPEDELRWRSQYEKNGSKLNYLDYIK